VPAGAPQYLIVDDQVLLEAMYTHPEEIHRLLGMVTDFIIAFAREARRLLPRPVPTSFSDVYFPDGQGICLCDDLAAVVSPWLYRDFVLPHMNRVSDAFGGLFLHACGNPSAVFPVWGEIRGFRGLDIGATEADLAQAFRWFSGSAVIACHVGLNSAPHFGSRLAVVEEVLQHVTLESSVLINASTYIANLSAMTPAEWDAESAQIVERVRAHSRQ
jgi:uroporphyrinogen-III decarboxylase